MRRIQMQDSIEAGTILIKEHTVLPEGLGVEIAPYATGWEIVKNLDSYALGRTIHNAGWTFFCMVGETESIVFGFGREKAIRTAVARILGKVKLKKFNSLEITIVVSKRFCGVPYLRLSARSRHIQDSATIFQPADVQVSDRSLPAAA
jgi:hypothetical protein